VVDEQLIGATVVWLLESDGGVNPPLQDQEQRGATESSRGLRGLLGAEGVDGVDGGGAARGDVAGKQGGGGQADGDGDVG
jgi:hypothetical protein